VVGVLRPRAPAKLAVAMLGGVPTDGGPCLRMLWWWWWWWWWWWHQLAAAGVGGAPVTPTAGVAVGAGAGRPSVGEPAGPPGGKCVASVAVGEGLGVLRTCVRLLVLVGVVVGMLVGVLVGVLMWRWSMLLRRTPTRGDWHYVVLCLHCRGALRERHGVARADVHGL